MIKGPTLREKLKTLSSVVNTQLYKENRRNKKRKKREVVVEEVEENERPVRFTASGSIVKDSRQAILAAIEFGDCNARVIFDLNKSENKKPRHKARRINQDTLFSEEEVGEGDVNNVLEQNLHHMLPQERMPLDPIPQVGQRPQD